MGHLQLDVSQVPKLNVSKVELRSHRQTAFSALGFHFRE